MLQTSNLYKCKYNQQKPWHLQIQMIDIITISRSILPSVKGGSPLELPLYISLILKLTVHSTYTEKLQRNELIKLYTIYTSTVNRLMEFTGRTDYLNYISNKCGHRNVLSKRQVWMSIFHIINFRKKKFMDTGVLDFFKQKKLILDY